MEKKIEEILAKAKSLLPNAKTKNEVAAIGADITGPNGALTALMKVIPTLDKAERPAAGKMINLAKKEKLTNLLKLILVKFILKILNLVK